MGNPPAWHPDPTGRHEHRYWDGEQWTDHVADAGRASTDPLDGGATQHEDTAGTADATSPASPADAGAPTEPMTTGRPTDAGIGEHGSPPASSTPPIENEAASAPASPTFSAPPAGGPPPPTGGPTFPSARPVADQPAAGGTDGLAVAALILGILSLLVGFIPFVGLLGTVGGIAAVVLGIASRRKIRRTGASGGGMAVTGIVTGALAIVLSLAITIGSALFFQSFSGDFSSLVDCIEETGDEQFCEDEFERNLLDRFN